MTIQVAKNLPKTIQELMGSGIGPDELLEYSLDELKHLHSLAIQGDSKPAKRMADIISGRITAKTKDERKAGKGKPEPIANSTKTKDDAPAPQADTKPTPQTKPRNKTHKPAGKATQAGGTKPASKPAPKPTQAATKPASGAKAPEEKPEPKQRSTRGTNPLKSNGGNFPEQFTDAKRAYARIDDVRDVEQLANVMMEYPYQVYWRMDEEQADGNDTLFLVVFASPERVLCVDMSREQNSYMDFDAECVESRKYTMKEGRGSYDFPLALYVGTAI